MSRRNWSRGNRRDLDFGSGVTPDMYLTGTKVLWLRSDLGITLNGANVSAWADQWNDNDCTQATAANQPAYVTTGGPGGKPYLNFAVDFLDGLISGSIAGESLSLWVVGKPSANGTQVAFNTTNSPGVANRGIALDVFGSEEFRFYAVGAGVASFTETVSDTFHSLSGTHETTERTVYKDNFAKNTNTTDISINAVTDYSVGDLTQHGVGYDWEGGIAEIILVKGVAPQSERDALYNSYLKPRYGLP